MTVVCNRQRPPPRGVARDMRRQLIAVGLLGAVVVTLLLAIPGLRPVLHQIADMDPAWLGAAVALELASCVSFVVVFRLFFERLAPRRARSLAWTSMASGALLPAGGVGGLAVSGWFMSLMDVPAGWIVRRSSGLFVVTSVVNVVAVIAAGLLLLAGAGGPDDLLHAAVPIAIAALVMAAVAALSRRPGATDRRGRLAWIGDGIDGVRDVGHALRRPSWRLGGAVGYLAFDIAALWATLAAIGVYPPIAALVMGYLIGYLANALPVPGGIGVLDAGLAGALTLYGIPAVDAAAAVLVYHAIAGWVPGAGMLVAFARSSVRQGGRGRAGAHRLAAGREQRGADDGAGGVDAGGP